MKIRDPEYILCTQDEAERKRELVLHKKYKLTFNQCKSPQCPKSGGKSDG